MSRVPSYLPGDKRQRYLPDISLENYHPSDSCPALWDGDKNLHHSLDKRRRAHFQHILCRMCTRMSKSLRPSSSVVERYYNSRRWALASACFTVVIASDFTRVLTMSRLNDMDDGRHH